MLRTLLRLLVLTIAIASLPVSASATASPQTRLIRLNWTEHRDYSAPSMRFHVSWVKIAGSRWTVAASCTNLGKTTLRIETGEQYCGQPSPCYGFSIVKIDDPYHSPVATSSTPAILLLADEPTGNLDSTTGAEIMELLLRLREERGMTLIVATHDPVIASRCDRILRLLDGRLTDDVTVPRTLEPEAMLERISRMDV